MKSTRVSMFIKIYLLSIFILSKYIPENTFLAYYGILLSCLKKKIPGLVEFLDFFRYIIALLKKQNKAKRKQNRKGNKTKTDKTKHKLIIKGLQLYRRTACVLKSAST